MKNILFIFLFLSSYNSFSQSRLEYADFIQTDTVVKWAAIYNSYINLSPANPNFNITSFYIKKLQTGTAKAYIEDSITLAVTEND